MRKQKQIMAAILAAAVMIADPVGISIAIPGTAIFQEEAQAAIKVQTPKASGTKVYSGNGSTIDASNTADGYVMVKQAAGSTKRLKVQVIMGSKSYNYDLNTKGNYEVFPLQMGNGSYTIRVLKNTTGSSYSVLYSTNITVKLSNSNRVFLFPNQYVNFSSSSKAVKQSESICKGVKTEAQKSEKIYNWVIKNIKYDTKKANTVQSGYLPNVDNILSTKKGICFDYAALTATMLRAQGIPARLVVGTVKSGSSDLNHAWNEIFINGKWTTIKIDVEANTWERIDTTFAASGGTSITRFIGNGKNYTGARVY